MYVDLVTLFEYIEYEAGSCKYNVEEDQGREYLEDGSVILLYVSV